MANERSHPAPDRQQRLAEALRANLKRRKDQARGRRAAGEGDAAPGRDGESSPRDGGED